MTTKNMFLSGEAAYGYVHLNNIRPYREQLKGKFDWGTFYMPPITSDTWPKAAGAPQRAHAASGLPGGYAGDGFFMVPQQTVKSGNLDRAVDLIQWITAPEQLAYFGKNTEPRSAKVGQTVKEIYPDDPMMQDEYRFHYEPAGILDGMRYGTDEWWHMVGIGAEDGWHKTNQACLAGQMTAEQAAAKLQEIAVQATDRFIQETPNLNPPANTWK